MKYVGFILVALLAADLPVPVAGPKAPVMDTRPKLLFVFDKSRYRCSGWFNPTHRNHKN